MFPSLADAIENYINASAEQKQLPFRDIVAQQQPKCELLLSADLGFLQHSGYFIRVDKNAGNKYVRLSSQRL